jgi:hypothetical protein
MVQQLKQHNLGMRLRLTEAEFLIAQGPVFPQRGVRRVRMRVERDGFAERSYHELAPRHTVFNYCSIQIDERRLAALADVLQAACAAQETGPGGDPQAHYRTVEYWDGGRAAYLCVEYVDGQPAPAAPLFEAAWQLLESQFVVTQ